MRPLLSPIISIISGPRQSGKTTLIRHLYPHLPYINLERPDMRERVILCTTNLFPRKTGIHSMFRPTSRGTFRTSFP
ncbi:MAG: AAA family ATPase [Spirochaetia bacterium]